MTVRKAIRWGVLYPLEWLVIFPGLLLVGLVVLSSLPIRWLDRVTREGEGDDSRNGAV